MDFRTSCTTRVDELYDDIHEPIGTTDSLRFSEVAIAALAQGVSSALSGADDVESAKAGIGDAMRAALAVPDLLHYPLPPPALSRYRQHLLHIDPAGRFSIVALIWYPGHRTPVHDHLCWCCFGVWSGRESSTVWGVDERGALRPKRKIVHYPGHVEFMMPPGDIHSVVNDDMRPSVSIHIYGTDVSVSKTSIRRCYDNAVSPGAPDLSGHSVAIVGGGFSGTMAAIHLLRRNTGARVTLFEPCGRIGRGLAYGTESPRHLLNVRCGGMSAFPDKPDDFFDWCLRKGLGVTRNDFVPRKVYGEYLGELFQTAAKNHPGRIETHSVRIVGVDRSGRDVTVKSEDGIERRFSSVILAFGTPPDRKQPVSGSENRDMAPLMMDPWRNRIGEGVRPGESVLIVGSGLSCFDVLSDLEALGGNNAITVLSRHGLLSSPHRVTNAESVLDKPAFLKNSTSAPARPPRSAAWCAPR